MSEILRNVHSDDTQLPYYHGALLDQDVDKLLTVEGDFLLQSKHLPGHPKPKLFLATRVANKVRRFEVRKNDGGQIKIGNKVFTSVRKMVETHQKEPLTIGSDTFTLKKAIPKGKFQLNHEDIRLIKKIGSGAYGTVYRGILMRDNRVIAVKRLDSEGADDEALTEMMKEARVMQMYDHMNIVRFYGFIVDRMPYLLVMEYCDGGAVEDSLRNKGKKITIPQRVDWTTQMSWGLEYLHSKECIHRDIATRNCLIDKGVIKLADFGMCRPTSVYKVDLNKPTNVRWLAPEVWRVGETRYNTDIYAFGVMIWEMFEIPYQCPYSDWKAGVVKSKVMAGYRMPPSSNMPAEMAEVMELAWHHDPNKRPSAPELRKMLSDVNEAVSRNTVPQKSLMGQVSAMGKTRKSSKRG